ncbi:unnamed protein product, partial [Mesorhabditis belari]|uniref:Aspartylglucosaminidase n=1 Tax=Mesorhabditis belari TaxID=2138241 RepID=A0AAF3E8H1_9BILA
MLIFDILLFIGVVKAQIVVTTWGADGFQEATFNAFEAYRNGNSRMASLVEGLSTCERLQCDTTVGYGGSPDENGETTLDALLIDGPGHKMSGVAQLRRVKDAARVAWAVMNYTEHTMLVGEQATQFALRMGFSETDLTTNASLEMLQKWKNNNCQPNFWTNVFPNPKQTCGPYHRNEIFKTNSKSEIVTNRVIDRYNHDTIGMVIIDESGEISAGTSTNGASHKIPGRVGDSSIPGSGAYLTQKVGGAAATGDGDVMMRFLPSYQTVEFMRQGAAPRSYCGSQCESNLRIPLSW